MHLYNLDLSVYSYDSCKSQAQIRMYSNSFITTQKYVRLIQTCWRTLKFVGINFQIMNLILNLFLKVNSKNNINNVINQVSLEMLRIRSNFFWIILCLFEWWQFLNFNDNLIILFNVSFKKETFYFIMVSFLFPATF